MDIAIWPVIKFQHSYKRLSNDEEKYYYQIKNSKPICDIIHNGLLNENKDIINFDINNNEFKFTIIESSGSIISNVKGFISSSDNVYSLTYVINTENNFDRFIDMTTVIEKNVKLNEVLKVNKSNSKFETIYVSLEIGYPECIYQKIEIDCNSDLYKSYSNREIDSITLYRLAIKDDNNNKIFQKMYQ